MRLISTHAPSLANFFPMYMMVWKKTCRSSKISLNSPRVRLDSDGTHGLKEFKCLLPSISFLATGHCCTIAKPAKLRVRYPINIWSWYYLPTFQNTQNEEHPLAKSNIHERGMSLGPLCTLYMYGMYVIQKKHDHAENYFKKPTDLNSANVFAVILPTPRSPPNEKNNIIGSGKATRWASTSYKWSYNIYNPTYRTVISPYVKLAGTHLLCTLYVYINRCMYMYILYI